MVYEVPAVIELLHAEKEKNTRYAGVLILKELIKNSTDHSQLEVIFSNIRVPLRDASHTVREEAARLLAACLEIVTQEDHPQGLWYLFNPILQDAQVGLDQSQASIIHGSLITYRECLLHARTVS